MALGSGGWWTVSCGEGTILRIDPGWGTVEAVEFPAGGFPVGLDVFETLEDSAASTIWVGTTEGMLFSCRLDGPEVVAIEVGTPIEDVLIAFDTVWVLDHQGKLLWFDPVWFAALGNHGFHMKSYQVDVAADQVVVAFPDDDTVFRGNLSRINHS